MVLPLMDGERDMGMDVNVVWGDDANVTETGDCCWAAFVGLCILDSNVAKDVKETLNG